MNSLVKTWAEELGFVACGFVRARKMTETLTPLKEYIARGYNAEMGYLERNIEARIDPSLLLPGVKTLMVFLAPYRQRESQPEGLPKIATYAWGLDYHIVIKNKLYEIVRRIRNIVPELKARVFTDSAPILERLWAKEAGLGFIGKNGFLISREHGLHNLIGIILVDIEMDYSLSLNIKGGCGTCRRCLDACPSGAIVEPFVVDSRKCISYQTIESKKKFCDEEYRIDRKGYIFGCDICMDVCPWVNRAKYSEWGEFAPLFSEKTGKKIVEFSKEEWLALSEEYFAELFKNSPLKRVSLSKIKDNLEP
jgi:epoxyqueuosine reductase